MNLKESYRYQNYLESLFNQACSYICARNNITITTEEHLRSKANPDANDEVMEVKVEKPYSCTNDQLIDFMCEIIDERRMVAIAIHKAKSSAPFASDAEVSVNRQVQTAAKVLSDLCMLKCSEKIIRGTDYKFNAEGNQVPYNYDIRQTIRIDFDQAKAKEKSRKLFELADFVSADADRFLIETTVLHVPAYNVNENFDDAVGRFLNKSSKLDQ